MAAVLRQNGAMASTRPHPAAGGPPITYCLYIRVARRAVIEPGRLGARSIERGWYVYTGSAVRNMAGRLRHHLGPVRSPRWHIDWLLSHEAAEVEHVVLEAAPECSVNAAHDGRVVIPRFGASDCAAGCGSHLLRLGRRRPPVVPRSPRARRTHRAADAAAGAGR